MKANKRTKVIKVESPRKVAAAARQGSRALADGKIVGFATETVYGLAALATNAAAMERLREIKDRPKRPFSVLVGGAKDIGQYVSKVPAAAGRLIRRTWPGPVTVLLSTGGVLADRKLQAARMHDVLCHNGVIGLRCPDEPVALAMLSEVAGPVVAPSANPPGLEAPRNADEVLASLDGQIDLLIDSGPTRLGQDSTIVRFEADSWRTIRKGPLDTADIRAMMSQNVLFVCTGNTCRSPMAAGLGAKLLADREPCRPGQLARRGVSVLSAGICAFGGSEATPEAVKAAGGLGADISGHRSRNLTAELIKTADVVLCMTDFHVSQVRQLSPDAGSKVFRLDRRGDLPDPIGGGRDVYVRTARRIEDAIRRLLDEEVL